MRESLFVAAAVRISSGFPKKDSVYSYVVIPVTLSTIGACVVSVFVESGFQPSTLI